MQGQGCYGVEEPPLCSPPLCGPPLCSDVVASLRDGRWGTQQANMAAYSAREFGGRAKIQYLLEGGKEPAPPWACSCARCASKTGDERATGRRCLREGYPIVRAVGEAIAEVEQQYEVVRTQSFSETVSYQASQAITSSPLAAFMPMCLSLIHI